MSSWNPPKFSTFNQSQTPPCIKTINDNVKRKKLDPLRNPTMKKSSKVGVEECGRNHELNQQLRILEKEWETIKKKRKLPNRRRCSTGSDSSSLLINSFDYQLLENSPRELMYSLQRRRSPSDGFLRDRNCDMAVVEVLRERRAAIMSGKFKGRRLFVEAEGACEVELDYDDGGGVGGGKTCGDRMNVVRDRQVAVSEKSDCRKDRGEEDAISLSCSLSDVSLSEEKEVVAEEKVVMGKRRGGGGGERRCVAWLIFLLMLLVLGLSSMSCNGKSGHGNALINLVPT